jgi:hypothetical protein
MKISSLLGDFIPKMEATTSTKQQNFQAVGIKVTDYRENLAGY